MQSRYLVEYGLYVMVRISVQNHKISTGQFTNKVPPPALCLTGWPGPWLHPPSNIGVINVRFYHPGQSNGKIYLQIRKGDHGYWGLGEEAGCVCVGGGGGLRGQSCTQLWSG